MSTREAVIRNAFNLDLGDLVSSSGQGVSLGASLGGRFQRVAGNVVSAVYQAETGVTLSNLRAVPIVTHKWAAKVGKYNDDPLWGEIFRNIGENRRRLKEELNP
jgi:hypothetical protein